MYPKLPLSLENEIFLWNKIVIVTKYWIPKFLYRPASRQHRRVGVQFNVMMQLTIFR